MIHDFMIHDFELSPKTPWLDAMIRSAARGSDDVQQELWLLLLERSRYILRSVHPRAYIKSMLPGLLARALPRKYGREVGVDVEAIERNPDNLTPERMLAIVEDAEASPSSEGRPKTWRVDCGVSRCPSGRWRAYATVEGRQRHLGMADNREEALDLRNDYLAAS